MREIIIIIFTITLVIVAGIIINNYLADTSDKILQSLEALKLEIMVARENGESRAKDLANESMEKWKDISDTWAMLIIHEELDKIELSLIKVNTTVNSEEWEDGLQEIEQAIFLVGHIKEKEETYLKNIF